MFIDKKYMLTEYSLSVSHIFCNLHDAWKLESYSTSPLCSYKKTKKKKKTSPLC